MGLSELLLQWQSSVSVHQTSVFRALQPWYLAPGNEIQIIEVNLQVF